MITMQTTTPQQLNRQQDQLLAAGSKLSFKEIYNLEMDIPVVKGGKYYPADKVDNVFVILNGVLTDISEQTYRHVTQLGEARRHVDILQRENEDLRQNGSQINALQQEIAEMDTELDTLEHAVVQLNDLYRDSQQQAQELREQVLQLQQEKIQLIEALRQSKEYGNM